MRIYRDLGLGKRSIAVAVKLLDHFGGMPTATESGGMSSVTKLKAPTTDVSPIVTPGMTTLWLPTLPFFFRVTFPRFPVHAAPQPITIKNNQRPHPTENPVLSLNHLSALQNIKLLKLSGLTRGQTLSGT
jgi:hypothetical protein